MSKIIKLVLKGCSGYCSVEVRYQAGAESRRSE